MNVAGVEIAMRSMQESAQLFFVISQAGLLLPWVGEPTVFAHTGSQVLTLGKLGGDLYLWGVFLFEVNLWIYPKSKLCMNLAYLLITVGMIWAFFRWPLAFINEDINIAFSFVMLLPGYVIAFLLTFGGWIIQNVYVYRNKV